MQESRSRDRKERAPFVYKASTVINKTPLVYCLVERKHLCSRIRWRSIRPGSVRHTVGRSVQLPRRQSAFSCLSHNGRDLLGTPPRPARLERCGSRLFLFGSARLDGSGRTCARPRRRAVEPARGRIGTHRRGRARRLSRSRGRDNLSGPCLLSSSSTHSTEDSLKVKTVLRSGNSDHSADI